MGASEAAAAALVAACERFGVTDPVEQAHLLGQLSVESAGFARTVESLNYSPQGLAATFSRKRISLADCQRLGRIKGRKAQQEAIANLVYGGVWGAKYLGNTEPGDGWRFIGHGLIQTTGRWNHTALSRGMFGDDRLARFPASVAEYPLAADSALWYWVAKKCGPSARLNDPVGVTRRINPALHGLDHRIERTRFALGLLT